MQAIIIGGGITGLTTALAFQNMNIDFQVYEKSPELNEVGAGIWMQPNALKVLDWLGIGDDIRKTGAQLKRAEVTNKELKPLRSTKEGDNDESQKNQITAIHRARLQKILFDHLPINTVHLGKGYLSHQEEAAKVMIKLEQGNAEGDVLIGADGIHSRVRQHLFPNSQIRYSGQTCWRGIANINLSAEFKGIGREVWGNGVRFGFSNISESEVYWFAVAKAPANGTDDRDKLKGKLKLMFSDFHPIVQEILESTPLEKMIRNDISDLKRLDHWHAGKVCLVGDAGHATTPNMGQGACQGMEDAYYLVHFLKEASNPENAFQKFEEQRRGKVDFVVNNSWRFGQMAHSSMGRFVMKTIMKMTPEKVLEQQMQNLYKIKTDF